MVKRYAPTIIASRTIAGIVPSSSTQNVAWNSDGQCLIVHRRGVVILTPYITSTLTPPATLVDPNLNIEYATSTVNRAKRKALAAEEGDVDMEEGESPSGPSKRCRRPLGGELMFWQTAIGMESEAKRDRTEQYGWAEVGDEFNGTIADRDTYVKKAVWSPSGLSELGGCYLAVLTTLGQVSIYAPRSDPASQRWDEIADLTLLTKQMLGKKDVAGSLSVRANLEMRTIGLEWSESVPVSSANGESGGILAIANRAGMIGLWVHKASRRFERIAYLEVGEGFVTQMRFAPWRKTYDDIYDSQLALASSDGSVSLVAVRQQQSIGSSVGWDYLFGDVKRIDEGDRRAITAIIWIGGLLIWSKAGTICLWNDNAQNGYTWQGLKTIRLEKVGNWASANAMGAPVAIEPYGNDAIVVTLSSLTRHIIGSLHTSPAPFPLADSLRLSVGSRDCFYDYLHTVVYSKERLRDEDLNDRDVTARMSGLAGVGTGWAADSWAVEDMHYHNLNSSTEGNRALNFMVADLSGVLGDSRTMSERLEALLSEPPRVASQSPSKSIMPYVMRVLASADPQAYAEDLLEMCDFDTSEGIESNDTPSAASLMRELWDDQSLDGLRIRYVIALWAARHFVAYRSRFAGAVQKLLSQISGKVQGSVLRWTAQTIASASLASLTPRDRDFMRASLAVSTSESADIDTIRALLDEGDSGGSAGDIDPTLNEDKCPACHEPVLTVAPGTAKCSKGHEWARCAMTNLLITTSSYRVCNTCPAISLFPAKFASQLLPVTLQGETIDWQRFVGTEENREMVETLLEAAIVCVLCGGRWVRSM